ncbi:hypothetical protein AYO22_07318 [Fonsecaea multimorphosa]|nr:hypothetical protein AYO22_07318 [Fonsecaea multimorphosa]
MEDGRLKVIIAGAGIAGLATAIALRSLSYIDVELYERSPELTEIGASIALSPNGLRTLERLGVSNALEDEVAFRGPAGIPMIYRHWKTNEVVSVDHFEDVSDLRHQTARFHRAHLHQALLQHVPRESIHLDKKVIGAKVEDLTVRVEFQDGTMAVGDLLIGADGINSKVRKVFVPHFQLSYTNRTALRATFDMSLVEHIPDLPIDSTHWWGQDRNFFASRLGRNQFTVVGMYNPANLPQGYDSDIGSWNDVGSVELFRELYRYWNPVVRALTEATPTVRRFPNYAGQAITTWVFGSRATLVGDAAHAHGGAHATGGSLALDDAYALYLSLRHTIPESQGSKPTGLQLRTALDLYEETRRPHTDRLLRNVHSSMKETPPQTDEELRRKMLNRASTTWLSEHDVQRAFAGVVAAHAGHDDTAHSKAYWTPDGYVGKQVIVVGGNVFAVDIVSGIQGTVREPLYLAKLGSNESFKPAFELPNVVTKPTLREIRSTPAGTAVEFDDGTRVSGIEKVVSATGYRLSYPFLPPDPGDAQQSPSRILPRFVQNRRSVPYHYCFAGREAKQLPPHEQDLWETGRLHYKGPGISFREIKGDWSQYYGFLRDLAGPSAADTSAYELPPGDERWAELGFEVIQLKDRCWKRSAQNQLAQDSHVRWRSSPKAHVDCFLPLAGNRRSRSQG